MTAVRPSPPRGEDAGPQIKTAPDDSYGLGSGSTLSSPSFRSQASSFLRRSPPYRMDSPDTAASPPGIPLARTWDSDSDESSSGCSGDGREVDTNGVRIRAQSEELPRDEQTQTPSAPKKQQQNEEQQKRPFSYDWLQAASLLYVAQFAAFGYLARVFVGRFFGADCAAAGEEVVGQELVPPNDVFSNFFVKVCVTNNGLTDQTGGALFIDLPANMIGCFIMGMITHPHWPDRPLPWMDPKHSLQKHKAFIDGLRTGFCGCLTTFASWNTQMVRMLDGTATVLGPQVVPALFGYVIGLLASFSSFAMGRLAHEFLTSRHKDKPNNMEEEAAAEDEEAPPQDKSPAHKTEGSTKPPEATTEEIDGGEVVVLSPTDSTASESVFSEKPQSAACRVWRRCLALIFNVYSGPPLFLLAAVSLCLVGAVQYDLRFYQEVVLAMCMAPLGALLRWWLTDLNPRDGPWPALQFVPWGTLIANVSAAVISVLIAAVQIRYLSSYNNRWTSMLLPAVKSGLAGSLSTVSTMIKEMFAIERPADALIYATASLLLAMLLSLLVFSPITRS